MLSSEEESEGVESDIWTEYGGEVAEDKTGKDRVYLKWKPPKNKLTQEIQRKKSGKIKYMVTAMEDCSAGSDVIPIINPILTLNC